VFLAYDKDKAGQAALWRSVPLLQTQGLEMRVVDLPTGKDPDEFIKNQPNLWKGMVDEAKPVFDYLLSRLHHEYDTESPKGKRAAIDAVAPFIAATPDPVEREFLIHRAANAIGVEESLLRQDVRATDRAAVRTEQPLKARPKPSSRQDTLARHFLGTVLSTSPEEVSRAELRRATETLRVESLPEPYQPIFSAIRSEISAGNTLKLESVAAALPPEAILLFDELCLAEGVGLTASDTMGQAHWRENIGDRLLQISHQLNTLHLKERLQHITRQIKQAEALNLTEQEALKKEFTQVSQQLAQQEQKDI
jgi:DNA primase